MAHVTHSTATPELEHHGSGGYLIIWIILLVLTGLTWWTGQMHLPVWGIYLAMFIATVKAALVVLFFMHLWEQKGVNRITFGFAVIFALVFFIGTMSDILTRPASLLPTRDVVGQSAQPASAPRTP
jgi:cytochrome c oxidase subunit IV